MPAALFNFMSFYLSYIDDFTIQFLTFINLIFLMFFMVWGSGRLFSYFINVVFFYKPKQEKRIGSKKQKEFYDKYFD